MVKTILPKGWVETNFETLLNYEQPTKYIVESTSYNDCYKTPVLTAGKTFVVGHTDEKNGIYKDNLPVIIFDDFTTATQFVTFPFKIKSSAMKILQASNSQLNKKFIFYYMQIIKHNAVTHKRYWISDYSKNSILLPPLAEQHRIVAKVDTLFSELDKGVDCLQAVKAQLKTYRQAVLKWAFEVDNNTKTAYLHEIADIRGGITKGRDLTKYKIISLPYLSVANVQDGYLDLTGMKNIELKEEEKEKYLLKKDDVLYTEGGDKDKLGRGTIWKCQIADCVHQNHIFRARINTQIAIPEYIALYSQTQSAKDYFYSKAKQTVNLASINMTVLRALQIPLPDLNKQRHIVTTIESRLSICDKLEQLIDENLAKSDSLRQSILKKAFEGRLVPQDPSDESAEKLLERIKIERDKGRKK